jgi:hypothetical protein
MDLLKNSRSIDDITIVYHELIDNVDEYKNKIIKKITDYFFKTNEEIKIEQNKILDDLLSEYNNNIETLYKNKTIIEKYNFEECNYFQNLLDELKTDFDSKCVNIPKEFDIKNDCREKTLLKKISKINKSALGLMENITNECVEKVKLFQNITN